MRSNNSKYGVDHSEYQTSKEKVKQAALFVVKGKLFVVKGKKKKNRNSMLKEKHIAKSTYCPNRITSPT